MLNFSETVRDLRIKKNYTQEQLAAACGVSRQAVAKWESGVNLPDVEKLFQLSRLFEVSMDELLTGRPAPQRKSPLPAQNSNDASEKIVNQALQRAIAHNDPDEEIDEFISFIGERIGCDRMYIFEQNPDRSYKNTYEWCGRDIPPQKEYLQRIPLEDMALWLETFSRDEYVCIEDVNAIADTQPAVYRWLKPQGIRSILVCPLFGGRCFLGVDNPAIAFITQTSSLMGIMMHFTETMLQRRDLIQELKWASDQNDQISRLSKGVRYRLNVVTGQLQYDRAQALALGYTTMADTLAEMDRKLSAHTEFYDHLMIDGLQKALDTKENVSIEFLSYNADRALRWNRISFSPFLDHNGNVLQLYGVLQDLSDRHRMIEQYNKYISHLSGGMHICFLSQPCHLDYASDDLCNFLGYTREEFEEEVGDIYIRAMVEEDQPIFMAYVQRLGADPGIESCEYRLRKKDGTVVRVIDTMESVRDSSGIMYGYAHILACSDMQIMLEMAEENEKRQLAVINVQYEVLESLGKDYLNVYRVCLDEDRGQIIKLRGYVTKGMGRRNAEPIPYYRSCKQYIQDRVHPDDRRKMLEAMHPDTVRRALTEDDEYLVVYRVIDRGETHYYQLKYVRIPDPEQPERIAFVAGFKNVDKVIREELEQNEHLQNRLNIISAILQAFSCGYYYSRRDDTITELSNISKNQSRHLGKCSKFSTNRLRLQSIFPDQEVFRCINDFMNPDTMDARLDGRNYLSSQVYVAENCFVTENKWYQMYIFVVDRDPDGKVAHCIFAARDITEEKQREEEYIRSLGLASSRERAALQKAYTDALTCVMNRNAFERDFALADNYTRIGFIYCDANGLRETNNTQGHSKGDLLLQTLAGMLKAHFSVDCIYRIGGDEFVCMIGDLDKSAFEKRVREFTKTVTARGTIASVGASYGDPCDKETLLRNAEIRMYEMKRTVKGDGQKASEQENKLT